LRLFKLKAEVQTIHKKPQIKIFIYPGLAES